jgi:hypothetical protein
LRESLLVNLAFVNVAFYSDIWLHRRAVNVVYDQSHVRFRVETRHALSLHSKTLPFTLKGGDPAALSSTATLLRLHPPYQAYLRRRPPIQVRQATSGTPNSGGVTGGVYKARERIHRAMLMRDY